MQVEGAKGPHGIIVSEKKAVQWGSNVNTVKKTCKKKLT